MPEQRLTLADLPDTGLGEPRRSEWEEEGLARKSKVAQSCPTLFDPMDCSLPHSSVHGIFPGKSTGVGCYFLLQRIFPTQGSNPGLLHCRQTLYHLSHNGSRTTLKIHLAWASLVVQWLRIPVPMQGALVCSLAQKDPMCHGATNPVHHSS